MKEHEIIVRASRSKMVVRLILALLFVGLGIWLAFFSTGNGDNIFMRYPVLRIAVGLVGVAFFGVMVLLIIRKLFLNYGVKITDEGIYDNSTAVNTGLIKWKDIRAIDEVKVSGQQFIRILVSYPEYIIEIQRTFFPKRVAQTNYKNFGSPVQISAGALEIEHSRLYSLLISEYKKHTIL